MRMLIEGQAQRYLIDILQCPSSTCSYCLRSRTGSIAPTNIHSCMARASGVDGDLGELVPKVD